MEVIIKADENTKKVTKVIISNNNITKIFEAQKAIKIAKFQRDKEPVFARWLNRFFCEE